jgi:hypothetical protein
LGDQLQLEGVTEVCVVYRDDVFVFFESIAARAVARQLTGWCDGAIPGSLQLWQVEDDLVRADTNGECWYYSDWNVRGS